MIVAIDIIDVIGHIHIRGSIRPVVGSPYDQ